MARLLLSNAKTERSPLCIWIEPWGEDFWIGPGESITVTGDAGEHPVEVVRHDRELTVWFGEAFDVEVKNAAGNVVTCGYQRPSGGFGGV